MTDISSQQKRKVTMLSRERHEAIARRNRFDIVAEEPQRGSCPLVHPGIGGAVERRGNGDHAPRSRGRAPPDASSRRLTPPASSSSHGSSTAERRSPDQRVETQRQPGARARDRSQRGEAARLSRGRREEGARGPGRVAEDHREEQGLGQRHAYWRRGRADSRSSAARMPRRMSAGSGGHPSTNASTGMIWSTLPATA